MIDIWGHRIAYKMNEKCLRACVRSSINGCFVRDISYNQVIPLDLLDTSKDPYLESNIINWNSANHEICEKPINSKGYLPGLGPVHFIMEHKAFVLIHPLIKNNLLLKSNALPHPSLPTCRHLCIIEAYGNESVSLFENVLGISPQTLEKLVRRESSGFTLSFEAVDPRIEPLELITVFDQKNAKKSILECNYTVPDGKIIVHDAALNKIRSAMRVPGNPIKEDPNWSRMPVILCYTPGNEFCPKQQPNTLKKGKTPGPKSGGSWILIVPSLWGRIIWRCIVGPNRKRGLQRVRVGGLEEACVVSREAGHPTFPNDYPGTAGYLVHLSSRLKELESKWLRTPPGKRINYKKQGMPEFFKVEYYLSLLGNPGLGQIHEEHIVRVFIQTEDRGIPEEGSLLFKIQNGSDPIGYITSGGYSQTFGRGVGFGVVRRSCIESYFTIDNENFDFIVNSSTVDTEREVESLTWFMMHLNGPMRPCRIRRSC